MTNPTPTPEFMEVSAAAFRDRSHVVMAGLMTRDGRAFPRICMGSFKLGADGLPEPPHRPLLLAPDSLAAAVRLVEQAQAVVEHADPDPDGFLARDGELGLIRQRHPNGQIYAVLGWNTGGGVAFVPVEDLEILAVVLREAQRAMAEAGLDAAFAGMDQNELVALTVRPTFH